MENRTLTNVEADGFTKTFQEAIQDYKNNPGPNPLMTDDEIRQSVLLTEIFPDGTTNRTLQDVPFELAFQISDRFKPGSQGILKFAIFVAVDHDGVMFHSNVMAESMDACLALVKRTHCLDGDGTHYEQAGGGGMTIINPPNSSLEWLGPEGLSHRIEVELVK